MRTSASASARRLVRRSASCTWSVKTVTSCPASLAKDGSVRTVSNQSSRMATRICVASVRSFPAHHVLEAPALHVVDESGDHAQPCEKGRLRQDGHVLTERGGMVVD